MEQHHKTVLTQLQQQHAERQASAHSREVLMHVLEKNEREARELQHHCQLELQKLQQWIFQELGDILRQQQATLEKAGVPLFHVSLNSADIQDQRAMIRVLRANHQLWLKKLEQAPAISAPLESPRSSAAYGAEPMAPYAGGGPPQYQQPQAQLPPKPHVKSTPMMYVSSGENRGDRDMAPFYEQAPVAAPSPKEAAGAPIPGAKKEVVLKKLMDMLKNAKK